MSHFLEHVPNRNDVKDFIRKACNLSKKFVYIQQPFFDADGYLFDKGYKLFWSDWKGHPNRMAPLELYLILRDLKQEGLPINFSLHAYKRVSNANDPCIHPLSSKIDRHEYDHNIDPRKNLDNNFDFNIFKETICLITFSESSHKEILNKIRFDHTIFDSLNSPR